MKIMNSDISLGVNKENDQTEGMKDCDEKAQLLSSSAGEIKTLAEWQAECDHFYAGLKFDNHIVTNQWERFTRVLGILPVGAEREWNGRNKTGNMKDGRKSAEIPTNE